MELSNNQKSLSNGRCEDDDSGNDDNKDTAGDEEIEREKEQRKRISRMTLWWKARIMNARLRQVKWQREI